MKEDPYKEYLKESDPNKRYKEYAWDTAIGLQKVDGLETSEYLKNTAIRNIEGDLTFDEVNDLLESYYKEKPSNDSRDRTEEADKVSARIAAILSESGFSFSIQHLLYIHERLFSNIYDHAGKIRNYNVTKKEWVLEGKSVAYAVYQTIYGCLDHDLEQEKKFPYGTSSIDEIIHHLARFIANLWQVHPFCEGNTRTTAVFLIEYLRVIGFDVTNDTFAQNAWYFRNALVRANFTDAKKGIEETTEYLELFLRNLLLNENHLLLNRTLHISGKFKMKKTVKELAKIEIEPSKKEIENKPPESLADLSKTTITQINKLKDRIGLNNIFGRREVQEILGLKQSRSSLLLKIMLERGLTESVKGHGKGRYRFRANPL